MTKEFILNCDKIKDACSIIWTSEKYKINELEPYLYSIECDDGNSTFELINIEWPEADGRDEFNVLSLNNFQAVEGDLPNQYFLCFNAIIRTCLNKQSDFKKALSISKNQVIGRIQFKKNSKPILDNEGFEEMLFENWSDVFVDFEAK